MRIRDGLVIAFTVALAAALMVAALRGTTLLFDRLEDNRQIEMIERCRDLKLPSYEYINCKYL